LEAGFLQKTAMSSYGQSHGGYSATPRCTYSLTAAMLYITAVQRLRSKNLRYDQKNIIVITNLPWDFGWSFVSATDSALKLEAAGIPGPSFKISAGPVSKNK